MLYPDDDNGDALRRLEANGDDLTRPRDINFSVVFGSEQAALAFTVQLSELGYAVSIEPPENQVEQWDVNVVRHMTPSHRDISEFENLLQHVADNLGGNNDGWGCFTQTK